LIVVGSRVTHADRLTLLQIARAAISAHLQGVQAPVPDAPGDLGRPAGAFVTLRLDGTLRGCIGYLERDRPLVEVVASSAVSAASEDPRFLPIDVKELEAAHIEISVLGPLEPIVPPDPAEIQIGRHGLVIEQGVRRGLLLPQVAVEWEWGAEAFLAHTCIKAGLPPDAWKHGAEVFRFDAEVFDEAMTRGE
jgi:AmmeMemoRadiSam system protein A